MSDWQVGDLAVCVDAGPCKNAHELINPHRQGALVLGKAYLVIGLGRARRERFSLFVKGATAADQDYGFGFSVHRFRKIRPDEQEACEPEFVTLIKRAKRKVDA